jgi:hypothetical protein
MAPFCWNYKPAKKHCWLIFYERKILFRLKKNKLNKTDYKPDEHDLFYICLPDYFIFVSLSKFSLSLPTSIGPTNLATYFFHARACPSATARCSIPAAAPSDTDAQWLNVGLPPLR